MLPWAARHRHTPVRALFVDSQSLPDRAAIVAFGAVSDRYLDTSGGKDR